jgi:hypothetical protein
MPIISQFKNPGDSVASTEYNAVVNALNTTYDQLVALQASFTADQALRNRLLATWVNGLNVNVAGGVLRKVSDGQLITIAPFSVAIPASVTNRWLSITPTGTAVVSIKRPRDGYPIAQVTTNATQVASLVDRRSYSFEIDQTPERKILHAVKNASQQAITSGGSFQVVTGFQLESADGVNFNNVMDLATGIITVPTTAEYNLFTRVQITTPSATNLSAKLSFFVNGVEVRILEEKDLGGTLRITLSGIFEGTLNAGDLVTLRVSVGSGTGLVIPANNNSEVVLKVYG